MSQPTAAPAAPVRKGINMIDVRVGETLRLQSVDFGEISVTICAKEGQRVRLGVQAAPNVIVQRPARKQG
jgi:sRNA-binding carbon storage regulator CsrA